MTVVGSRRDPRRDWKPVAVSVFKPRMSLVLQSLLPHPNSCKGTSPHQQGWDTKMAHLSHAGIDVASDRLDVMLLPDGQCFWVANNPAGWAELVTRLRGLCIAAIGIEASGGYERGVIRALLAEGISVRQINPFKLRQFAKASGVLAKNDRLDARMIALFVATMPTRPAQRTRQPSGSGRSSPRGGNSATRKSPLRMRRDCSKMRASGVCTAAVWRASRWTSHCSTSGWPRWSPPMSSWLNAIGS